jgi:hypothetical protein
MELQNKTTGEAGMVKHNCNPATQEAEAGRLKV